jgi:hypothetical protein
VSGPNEKIARRRGERLKDLAAAVADRFGLRHRTVFDVHALHYFRGGDQAGWTCGAASVELRS